MRLQFVYFYSMETQPQYPAVAQMLTVSELAHRYGITRQTLRNRLKKVGFSRKPEHHGQHYLTTTELTTIVHKLGPYTGVKFIE